MATKRIELEAAKVGMGVLGKAEDNEPVFILRSQDKFAPWVVREWARMVSTERGNDHPKVREALDLATMMDTWCRATGKIKTPD